jgi:hypothetical protein
VVQRKAAETADFDPLASRERVADVVQHQLYSQFDVFLHQVRLFEGKRLNQL